MKLSFYLQKSSGIKEVHHDLEEKKYSEDEGNHVDWGEEDDDYIID